MHGADLNRSYQEMAEYYGTAIAPACPVSTKKDSAEGTVGVLPTWIMASLRNDMFFSFRELNEAIRIKLDESNPFISKEERLQAFHIRGRRKGLSPAASIHAV